MKELRKLLLGCLLAAMVLPGRVAAQSADDQPVRGPFWSGTIRGPKSNDAIAMKGLAITVGAERNAYVCYDTDLMRLSLAWTGEFLEFGNTLTKIEWPPPPKVKGVPAFGVVRSPGWGRNGDLNDPRVGGQGPLPKDWAHYRGLYVHGDNVVLKWSVGGTEVLELPGFERRDGQDIFFRTFQFAKSAAGHVLVLADDWDGPELATDFVGGANLLLLDSKGGMSLALAGVAVPEGTRLEKTAEKRLVLKLGRIQANKPFRLAMAAGTQSSLPGEVNTASLPDLRTLCQGGPALWSETVVTRGTLGTGNDAYVVDTLTEPAANPYNARTFFGGFDFFSDGRAALCTFHGDVWIVSGIDDTLQNLTWKRHAAGLFQALGLKIVRDVVYVLGRDQITRLHDLNGNGEADFYENFNNDTVVTANYHEFSLDLHTDTEGNFYFVKGAPWEPDVRSPHQGCLFKVSADGSRMEVFATGFRAPNGMTVGPRNEITVSDNQGHWIPASKLNWVEKGGFYGMTPVAQRELPLKAGDTTFVANPSDPAVREKFKFKGWDAESPIPVAYDQPLCWLPMNMDNSSGGQVWVTSDKWGPLNGRLLFMSYGKCTLFEVLTEEVDGVKQGAMVQLPLRFNSGVMRGRVNPRDGQVYLCGLKGWQTSATRDGGFYRVRYTGKPLHLPTGFLSSSQGVEITFSSALDAVTAADTDGYSVERWNYRYSGAYGSAHHSVNHPEEKKHDKLNVREARLLSDGRTVRLLIDDMKPADQLKIKYSIDAADGTLLSQEIHATLHKLRTVPAKH